MYRGIDEMITRKTLEMYFKQQFAETYQYRTIGSWWELKNGENEIDIVALRLEKNQAIVAEVKRPILDIDWFKECSKLWVDDICHSLPGD